jgi:hypothetical protein
MLSIMINQDLKQGEGGESSMKKILSVFVVLIFASLLLVSLTGCGADIKAENEKLKAEVASLKTDAEKAKVEAQKLKEEAGKAAEKDATIKTLTDENEALKKQVEELKAQAQTGRRPATKK